MATGRWRMIAPPLLPLFGCMSGGIRRVQLTVSDSNFAVIKVYCVGVYFYEFEKNIFADHF